MTLEDVNTFVARRFQGKICSRTLFSTLKKFNEKSIPIWPVRIQNYNVITSMLNNISLSNPISPSGSDLIQVSKVASGTHFKKIPVMVLMGSLQTGGGEQRIFGSHNSGFLVKQIHRYNSETGVHKHLPIPDNYLILILHI